MVHVESYVDFMFLQPSLIGDVYAYLDHELVLLYKGRVCSTDVLHIHIIIGKVIRITFIIDDHVVEHNTCFHYHT